MQNHVFQVLCPIAMEPPSSLANEEVRNKRLPARNAQSVIQLRQAPLPLVPMEAMQHANRLTIRVAPEERIQLRFQAKQPGHGTRLSQAEMAFSDRDLGGDGLATGYETLLHDCMIGERLLFLRADRVQEAWGVLAAVLDLWRALPPRDFPNYAAGTWRPASAEELLTRDGRHRIDPTPQAMRPLRHRQRRPCNAL